MLSTGVYPPLSCARLRARPGWQARRERSPSWPTWLLDLAGLPLAVAAYRWLQPMPGAASGSPRSTPFNGILHAVADADPVAGRAALAAPDRSDWRCRCATCYCTADPRGRRATACCCASVRRTLADGRPPRRASTQCAAPQRQQMIEDSCRQHSPRAQHPRPPFRHPARRIGMAPCNRIA